MASAPIPASKPKAPTTLVACTTAAQSRARRYSKNDSIVLECAPRKLGNDFELAPARSQFPAHPIRGQPRPLGFLALFARAMHIARATTKVRAAIWRALSPRFG